MKKLYFLPLLLFAVLALSACRDQTKIDEDKIVKYVEDNNLDAQSTSEGLYYTIDVEGTGDFPTVADEVTVDYEGFLLDGTKFDSSIDRGSPSTFPLNAVILGWQIGIPLYREGGSGKLIIPSELGYGKNPPPGSVIGKNEILVFDVELISIN